MTERARRAERRLGWALVACAIALILVVAATETADYYRAAHEKRDRIEADKDFIRRLDRADAARAAANVAQVETNCRQFRDGLRTAILRGAEFQKKRPGADPEAIDRATREYLAEVTGPIDCTLKKAPKTAQEP